MTMSWVRGLVRGVQSQLENTVLLIRCTYLCPVVTLYYRFYLMRVLLAPTTSTLPLCIIRLMKDMVTGTSACNWSLGLQTMTFNAMRRQARRLFRRPQPCCTCHSSWCYLLRYIGRVINTCIWCRMEVTVQYC